MVSNWSLWIFCFLGWLSQCLGDRLVIPPGAYARVTQPLTNHLDSFTLSAWVNVTHFTDGITPILTYINQDASSQVSFFMRRSGVGVLWGGPILKDEKVDLISRINRRPRLYWSDFSSKIRRRREADYSQGLGDIVNILERSGRADNSWAPLNFVDVGVMGVDDLMVSGSEDQDNILNSESRQSRAQTYSEWTNVPYELHMQESIQSHAPENIPKEPRIITQPSGDDDFVFFNWNVPQHPNQQRIPLGSNSWSPIWDPTKKPAKAPLSPTLQKPAIIDPPVKQTQDPNQPWSSQVQKVDITNEWDPVGFEEDNNPAQSRPGFRTKLLPTNVERPVWPSSVPINVGIGMNLPSRVKINTNVVEPNKEFKAPSLFELPTASFSNILPVIPASSKPVNQAPSTTTTSTTTTSTTESTTTFRTTTPKPTTRRDVPFKKHKPTPLPRRKIVPTFRTAVKPPHKIAQSETTTKPSLKRERTRTPLWKLIKKPEENSQSQAKTKPKEETRTQPQRAVDTSNQRRLYRYSLNDFQKKPKPKPRQPLPTAFSSKRPRPPIERLQISYSNNRNSFVPKPFRPPINKFIATTKRPTTTTTVTTTTTLQPETTTKIKRIRLPKPIIPKVPRPVSEPKRYDRRNPWSTTTKYKKTPSFPEGEDEFSKTMKDPKLVQEGNTAVVYAIPIQDEKEFYEMYKKYQEDTEKPNLHKLYQKMRKGGVSETQVQEEEENENTLQQGINPANFDKIISQTDLSITPTKEPVSKVIEATPLLRGDIQPETLDIKAFQDALKNTQENNENAEYEYEFFTEDDILVPVGEQYEYFYPDDETQNIENDDIKAESEINEANGSYFIPEADNDSSLADLYRGAIDAGKKDREPSPSFYIEPSTLSHQQLPPTYLKHDKVKGVQETKNKDSASVSEIDIKNLPQVIYSANPQELIAQGLLPKPIHAVETEEEAELWMNQQKKQAFIPQEILNQPTIDRRVNVPQQPFNQGVPPVDLPLNTPSTQTRPKLPFPVQLTPSQAERSPDPRDQAPILDIIHPRVPDGFPDPLEGDGTEELTVEDEVPLSIKIKELPYKFNPNGWYHVAFTWNTQSKKMFVYVNGEILGEITGALKDRTHLEEGGLFLLGRTLLPDLSDFDETSQFLGEISDLNLWTREFTPREIDLSFQCKKDPSSSLSLAWGDAHMNLYNGAEMRKSPQFCGLVS